MSEVTVALIKPEGLASDTTLATLPPNTSLTAIMAMACRALEERLALREGQYRLRFVKREDGRIALDMGLPLPVTKRLGRERCAQMVEELTALCADCLADNRSRRED